MVNEKMLKNESFIVIQGFMINDLKLKGNELLVYSCIYGFSQVKNQWFTGSIKYLTEWTGASRTTIISILKDFVKRGLLIKQDEIVNGVKFCKYRAITKNTTSTEIVPNNIEHNIDNNLVNNIDIYSEAVDYLNQKAGTKYKSNSKNTTKHIKARINDGYTLEDFKSVIDKKCSEWLNTDMEKYLCPDTLFGSKFEKYLNQKINGPKINKIQNNAAAQEIKWGD